MNEAKRLVVLEQQIFDVAVSPLLFGKAPEIIGLMPFGGRLVRLNQFIRNTNFETDLDALADQQFNYITNQEYDEIGLG